MCTLYRSVALTLDAMLDARGNPAGGQCWPWVLPLGSRWSSWSAHASLQCALAGISARRYPHRRRCAPAHHCAWHRARRGVASRPRTRAECPLAGVLGRGPPVCWRVSRTRGVQRRARTQLTLRVCKVAHQFTCSQTATTKAMSDAPSSSSVAHGAADGDAVTAEGAAATVLDPALQLRHVAI
jgi:hypothetical protein